MSKTLSFSATEGARPVSATALYLAAAALMAASRVLTRVAARLSVARDVTAAVQTVEFHPLYREAGAPEGALYVDGKLVGVIEGVRRL